MATLVLRTVKGTPLTNSEVDGNFSNINTEVGVVFNRANTINSNVGVLSNLTTTEKSNIVAAINEIASESTSNVAITGGTIGGVVISNSTWSGNTIAIAQGGTGSTTASAARTALGITTANTTELTNLYYTNARAYANIVLAGFYDTVSNTSPIGASESGTTLTLTHLNSGVTAGTYGNATIVPIVTVNATGHVTSVSNVSIATSSGSGSGLFNTSLSAAGNTAVDTTTANVYAAPSTSGRRYIIHSLQVTNISSTDSGAVAAAIVGSTYSTNSLGNAIPIPIGTSLELLKKPKILQPSDYITLSSNIDSVLHATATIEQVNSTSHFGAGVDLTSNTMTTLYTATGNCVIESVLLANDDPVLDVKASVVWTDGSDNIYGYYTYEMIVPNQSTVEVLEQPKFIPNGYKVRVQANQANRLEAIIAGRVI